MNAVVARGRDRVRIDGHDIRAVDFNAIHDQVADAVVINGDIIAAQYFNAVKCGIDRIVCDVDRAGRRVNIDGVAGSIVNDVSIRKAAADGYVIAEEDANAVSARTGNRVLRDRRVIVNERFNAIKR